MFASISTSRALSWAATKEHSSPLKSIFAMLLSRITQQGNSTTTEAIIFRNKCSLHSTGFFCFPSFLFLVFLQQQQRTSGCSLLNCSKLLRVGFYTCVPATIMELLGTYAYNNNKLEVANSRMAVVAREGKKCLQQFPAYFIIIICTHTIIIIYCSLTVCRGINISGVFCCCLLLRQTTTTSLNVRH